MSMLSSYKEAVRNLQVATGAVNNLKEMIIYRAWHYCKLIADAGLKYNVEVRHIIDDCPNHSYALLISKFVNSCNNDPRYMDDEDIWIDSTARHTCYFIPGVRYEGDTFCVPCDFVELQEDEVVDVIRSVYDNGKAEIDQLLADQEMLNEKHERAELARLLEKYPDAIQ